MGTRTSPARASVEEGALIRYGVLSTCLPPVADDFQACRSKAIGIWTRRSYAPCLSRAALQIPRADSRHFRVGPMIRGDHIVGLPEAQARL